MAFTGPHSPDTLSRTLDRLDKQIERLPPWFRPTVYAPLILTTMILVKARIMAIPFAIVLLIAIGRDSVEWGDLGVALQSLGIAYLGSAVSGLLYGLVGRKLLEIPRVGRYLCGILSIMPYMVAINAIVARKDTGSFLPPWDRTSYIILTGMSLLFGGVIGHTWFKDPKATNR